MILMDFGSCGEDEVFTSVEGNAGERRTEMEEADEPWVEFHHESRIERVLFYSWQHFGEFVKRSRRECVRMIGSVRSWNCRECVRRAAESIRVLFSYLSLFGGCASGCGAGGSGILPTNFFVPETRSRHGVFTLWYPRRVFCVPVGRFSFLAPGPTRFFPKP